LTFPFHQDTVSYRWVTKRPVLTGTVTPRLVLRCRSIPAVNSSSAHDHCTWAVSKATERK